MFLVCLSMCCCCCCCCCCSPCPACLLSPPSLSGRGVGVGGRRCIPIQKSLSISTGRVDRRTVTWPDVRSSAPEVWSPGVASARAWGRGDDDAKRQEEATERREVTLSSVKRGPVAARSVAWFGYLVLLCVPLGLVGSSSCRLLSVVVLFVFLSVRNNLYRSSIPTYIHTYIHTH